VIGAPVLFLTGLQSKSVWNYQTAGTGPGAIKQAKVALISKAFYEKCDALDGLKDGLVENPLKCDFDPARDLPKCANDADGADCFTIAQTAALKKVYGGPRDASGRQLFPGMPPGGDGGINAGFQLADSFLKYMAFDPAPGPSWDFHTFNIDTDLARMAPLALRIDATIPDLTAVRMRGAKIVHYHGWADPGVSPKMSIDYYNAVVKTVGAKETADFYRFFPVPGMFHCQGGPGCGDVDWLSAVMNWVEKGRAPSMLLGAHVEKGETKRTRPICAWPNTARYKGSGSIDVAENFTCEAPGL
jgi:feruloyl esterase